MTPDSGLADERTVLAWQRTALAVVAYTAIIGRLTFDASGAVAPTLLLVALTLALAAGFGKEIRHRDRCPGGFSTLALACATAALCVAESAVVASS